MVDGPLFTTVEKEGIAIMKGRKEERV